MRIQNNEKLEEICKEVRHDFFRTIKTAGSGHLGGCSSSTELMCSIYFGGLLNYDEQNPFSEDRDRVLVRGHLGPLRYKIFSMLGWIGEEELEGYRSLGSRLQGHESMDLVPGVDITPSGSLGMGLSYGVGTAIAGKMKGNDFKVYAFLGDGEEQEGNVSEAARHAVNQGLDNLVCILDRNKKQLSHPTSDVDKSDVETIWRGYGWDTLIIDGHNFDEIRHAFNRVRNAKGPTLIIADTIKGIGIEGAEESINGYHTISSCPKDELDRAIEETEYQKGTIRLPRQSLTIPKRTFRKIDIAESAPLDLTNLEDATDVYLRNLEARLGREGVNFYIMTADLVDRNYIQSFDFSSTTQFIDAGIREQHLFAMAHGISTTDTNSRIWIHSGDSFLYRASDQLNAICQGHSPMLIIGDRSGLGGGKNGPTHQSSGQPGLLLTMPGLNYLEPADMEDLFNCFNFTLSGYERPTYVRLHPDKVERLPSEESKNISNYVVYEPKKKPIVSLVGSGLAMKYATEAATDLEREGVPTRLINVVGPKTLDDTFVEKLEKGVPVLTLFNGNSKVLESAVSSAIMRHPSARPSRVYSHGFEYGTSGPVIDLLRYFGYDSNGIKQKIRGILE